MSSSLSAYAKWKLEEEERFYATFPAARCVAYLPTDTFYPAPTAIYCKPDVYAETTHNILAAQPVAPPAVPISKESVLTSALHYDYLPTNMTATASLQQPQPHLPPPQLYNDNFTQPSDAQYNVRTKDVIFMSKQLLTLSPGLPRRNANLHCV
jgi:hypothetical protein